MGAFALKRIMAAIPTMIGISILIFLMVRMLPGDVVDVLSGGDVVSSPELREQTRERFGLTGSYAEQYFNWIGNLLGGDFGFSLRNSEPVSDIITRAFPVTMELVVLALLIATVIGIPLGVLAAVRRDSSRDFAARLGALAGISIPNFWLATLLLLFTSRVFGWVPPLYYVPFYEDPLANLSQFALPALSMSVFTLAIVMRIVRSSLLEVLGQDYVRTARAKGVPRRAVVSRHALRNALIPVVTIVGFEIGILMGGSAIIETIFGLPGLGNTLISAISSRDYPLVQAVTLILAFIFIMANLLVDLLYGVLDPRISEGQARG